MTVDGDERDDDAGGETDRDTEALAYAIRDGDVASLAAIVALWRGRADYWRGRYEGAAEAIAILRAGTGGRQG